MVRKVGGLGIVVALTVWGAGQMGQAQELPPAPMPVVPSTPQPEGQGSPPPRPAFPPGPGPSIPPPAFLQPAPAPYQDNNGPLLKGDPLLDRPGAAPGWFGALEVDLLGAHVKNALQAPVTVTGFQPDTVSLPGAPLDWTGSPRLEIGYRFPEGFGELLVSYRTLITEGKATLVGFDLDGSDVSLKSRLNLNVVDIDYGSREYSLAPHWSMGWRGGVRLASVYFDSLADGVFIEERTSNNFYGVGPHAALDLERSLDLPELGMYFRVDGAAVMGQIRQGFEEAFILNDGSLTGGATTVHHTQAVPVLLVQTGLSWTPCWRGHRSRLIVGYEFQQWWSLGEAGDSRAELTTQGIFLRSEFGF